MCLVFTYCNLLCSKVYYSIYCLARKQITRVYQAITSNALFWCMKAWSCFFLVRILAALGLEWEVTLKMQHEVAPERFLKLFKNNYLLFFYAILVQEWHAICII